MAEENRNGYVCRVCAQRDLTLVRESKIKMDLTSDNFAITDSDYGVTAAIYDCPACGLRQCPEVVDVLQYYKSLHDPLYEEGRSERYLQAEKLVLGVLRDLRRENGKGLSLLDVGAGTGILVEVAGKMGFEVCGVEPSAWLAQVAQKRGLNVREGVLPHPDFGQSFDLVMLIDVIEHVSDPHALMSEIVSCLKPSGRTYLVTPDVSSFFSRLMGFSWWHYRAAHINYFNRNTLGLLARNVGLSSCHFTRPRWYFRYAYLHERLLQYLPYWILPPASGFLENFVIPLNLRDSLLMVCKRK